MLRGGQDFARIRGGSGRVPGWRLAWLAREMTEEDHRRFDEYRGAIRESPAVWWTAR
jgi:hypothetical protein